MSVCDDCCAGRNKHCCGENHCASRLREKLDQAILERDVLQCSNECLKADIAARLIKDAIGKSHISNECQQKPILSEVSAHPFVRAADQVLTAAVEWYRCEKRWDELLQDDEEGMDEIAQLGTELDNKLKEKIENYLKEA